MREMLNVERIRVVLGGKPILDDVSLSVPAGSFTALVGPNGSGKTTLLRAICGGVPLRSGRIAIDDLDRTSYDRRSLAKTVAVLRQENEIDAEFTVDEIVRMGRTPHKRLLEPDDAHDREIVTEALDLTDTAHLSSRIFTTLSGGEKQRVLLSRALAQRPRLLLLDEPTNHLDIGHQLAIMACVRRLGLTVLAALHDLNVVLRFADRAVLLERGRVAAAGPTEAALTEENIAAVFGVVVHRVQGPAGSVFAFG